jgi:hypothetical protein
MKFMGIFGRRRKRAVSEDAYLRAATLLYLAAKTETATESFGSLDPDIVVHLNALMFCTRVAILIGWLKRLEARTSNQKWPRLRHAFEQLVYPEEPVAKIDFLECIRQLDTLIDRAQSFTGSPQSSPEAFPSQMHQWWNDWLGLTFEPEKIEIIGYDRGLLLTMQVIDETQFLATILAETAKDLGEYS